MSERGAQENKYTLSTQAIEYITPSEDAVRLCKKILTDKVTADTVVEAIKKVRSAKIAFPRQTTLADMRYELKQWHYGFGAHGAQMVLLPIKMLYKAV